MKLLFSLFILLLSGYSLLSQSDRITKTIHSDILGEDRQYQVSLPSSYNSPDQEVKEYPLLIVLDARSHFDVISSIVEHKSRSLQRDKAIQEMIVVGVGNVDRERDFTPDKIVTVRENRTGGGDNFLAFLEKELLPELQDDYRIGEQKFLFGHSLAGLFTVHAYMQENSPFLGFFAIDPSFGMWDEAKMNEKLEMVPEISFDRYLYIATANWGKRNMNNRDRHIRFFEGLHKKSPEIFNAKLTYFENENHHSVPIPAFLEGIVELEKYLERK